MAAAWDSKEDTIHNDDDLMASGQDAADDIKAWLREEALKRERAVQEAQAAIEKARDELEARRDEPETRPLEGLLQQSASKPNTQDLIRMVCDELRDFLIEKNEQYGDSAIKPVRIFSKADPAEQLLVRLDDKLSRIARGDDRLERDEDVLDDLIGYLILYKVATLRAD